MRWLPSAVGAAALLGAASAQDADSKLVVDQETGFTFGQYQSDQGIQYRIAIPDPAPATGGYDTVVQIAAPLSIKWAGMAWGGSMTYNPLTLAWPSGTDVVLSSRFAFGYYVPPPYAGATYTVFKTGTHVNATHWQITAKCTGCTQWGDDDTGVTTLDPTQQNPLAFAFSTVAPETPSSNTSSFSIHDSIGHWYHDFTQGSNAGFSALVSKNSEGSGSSTKTPTASGSSTGKPTATRVSTPSGKPPTSGTGRPLPPVSRPGTIRPTLPTALPPRPTRSARPSLTHVIPPPPPTRNPQPKPTVKPSAVPRAHHA